jgi:hypothetical protein
MVKNDAKVSSRAKRPMDEHQGTSPEESEGDCCDKAFNAETARLEDADEPCRNGEG